MDASFSYKLGYWEYGGEYQQNVTVGGNTATLDFDKALMEQYGAASLYQGLYLKAGTHTFSADITLRDASARLFVKEALTGEIVAVKEVSSSGNAAVEFEVPREGVYLLGVDGGRSASGKADVSSFEEHEAQGHHFRFLSPEEGVHFAGEFQLVLHDTDTGEFVPVRCV